MRALRRVRLEPSSLGSQQLKVGALVRPHRLLQLHQWDGRSRERRGGMAAGKAMLACCQET